jgi:hypothetical protein
MPVRLMPVSRHQRACHSVQPSAGRNIGDLLSANERDPGRTPPHRVMAADEPVYRAIPLHALVGEKLKLGTIYSCNPEVILQSEGLQLEGLRDRDMTALHLSRTGGVIASTSLSLQMARYGAVHPERFRQQCQIAR